MATMVSLIIGSQLTNDLNSAQMHANLIRRTEQATQKLYVNLQSNPSNLANKSQLLAREAKENLDVLLEYQGQVGQTELKVSLAKLSSQIERAIENDSYTEFLQDYQQTLNEFTLLNEQLSLKINGISYSLRSFQLAIFGLLFVGFVTFAVLLLSMISLAKKSNKENDIHNATIDELQKTLQSKVENFEGRETELREALEMSENQLAMQNHASRRFQSLISGLPVGCMTFDDEGVIMEWNHKMGEIFRKQAYSAILHSVIDIFECNGRDAELQKRISQVCEDGEAVDFEWEIFDGENPQIIHMYWFPLRDPEGNPIGGIGCAIDVTEERTNKQELIAVSRMQKAVLDSAEYAIVSCSPDGTVTAMNRSALNLLGFDEVDPSKTINILDFHSRQELDLVLAENEAQTGEQIYGIDLLLSGVKFREGPENEWLYQRSDGSLFDARISITSLVDDENILHGYVLIFCDITEEKAIQERLRMLSLVASGAKNSVLVCDASSKILFANAAFEMLSGFEQSEAVGRSPFEILFGSILKKKQECY